MRASGLIAAGLLSGLLIGVLGQVLFLAVDVQLGSGIWPALLWNLVYSVALLAIPAGLNGCLGVTDGLRTGDRRLCPVLVPPLVLLATPFAFCGTLVEVGLRIAIELGLLAWVAGRAGQEIGVAGRGRNRPGVSS
jgi:hypothetical protein